MMKKNVGEAMWIVLFSLCIALTTNYVRPDGLPPFRPISVPPSSVSLREPDKGIVSFDDFLQKAKKSEALMLDARSKEDYRNGHIPGAKNLPFDEFSQESARVLKNVPFDREIITYCEGVECSVAGDLAVLVREMGYRNVKVFQGGWEEWTEKAMPVAEGKNGE